MSTGPREHNPEDNGIFSFENNNETTSSCGCCGHVDGIITDNDMDRCRSCNENDMEVNTRPMPIILCGHRNRQIFHPKDQSESAYVLSMTFSDMPAHTHATASISSFNDTKLAYLKTLIGEDCLHKLLYEGIAYFFNLFTKEWIYKFLRAEEVLEFWEDSFHALIHFNDDDSVTCTLDDCNNDIVITFNIPLSKDAHVSK